MIHSLYIDSIQKKMGHATLLSDISLQCTTGQIIGLLGRNGSGKSTLLKIIFGSIQADYKFVKLNNILIKGINSNIKYLPQHPFIPAHLTVKGAAENFINIPFKEFCNDAFINAFAEKKVSQLSGGERRYLEVMLLICTNAKFLLLDEPLNGVSSVLAEKLLLEIQKAKATKGIIISGHNYHEIMSTTDKTYLLRNGKNISIHSLADFKDLQYIM
jgi:ABC-type multidrug transport system ATPase subunit